MILERKMQIKIHELRQQFGDFQSNLKMERYGAQLTLYSVRELIQDIAGVRVICNYIDDI